MLLALALVLTATAPYEDFPAADFTRGERPALGEVSIGLYSHYQQFEGTFEGEGADGASEIHHERWVPVFFADWQLVRPLRLTWITHGGIVRTDLHEAVSGERRTETIAGFADTILLVQWLPFLMGEIDPEHHHSFFDAHNLSIVAGPKIDLAREDSEAGTTPGAVFRRTGSGTHDLLVGIGYTFDLGDVAWLYDFVSLDAPLTRTNFGLRPGVVVSEKLGASWLPSEVLQLFLEVDYTFAARGKGGTIASAPDNTGGHEVSLDLGITADIAAGFGIEISLGLPIFRRLNGSQAEEAFDLFFGLYQSFR